MYIGTLVWTIVYVRITERRAQEQREAKMQLALREAELRALEAQINPHFLFNCLNSIRGLVVEDPPKAQDMITRFATLLRYNLNHDSAPHRSAVGGSRGSGGLPGAGESPLRGPPAAASRHRSGGCFAAGSSHDPANAGRERAEARRRPAARGRRCSRFAPRRATGSWYWKWTNTGELAACRSPATPSSGSRIFASVCIFCMAIAPACRCRTETELWSRQVEIPKAA